MPKGLKVCIIGAESWGSAIATAVCKNVLNGEFDSRVHIYVYDELVKSNYLSELINEQHENIKYLPGIRLPKNLIAVNDLLEAAKDADILIFATPQSFIKPYCNILAGNVKHNAYAVSLVKGLDNIKDGVIDLYSHTIAKQLNIPCYSMMNANSAMEMAQGKLCEITIGCNHDAHAKQLTKLFQTDNCMVFSIDDVDGVELCNTLKDLVALSAGFIDGLRLGENTRVACLHLGLKEMMRFIKNFNPTTKMSTFFESCGIANSVASSFADKNVTLANNFVTSKKTIQEIEMNLLNGRKLLGPIIAEKMYAYLEENALLEIYPLFSVIHRICQKEVPPHAIVETLRNHPDMSSSQMMKTNRLVLLRHGESEFNLKNLFCGWHDAPLSACGLEQARTIAAANLIEAKLEFDKVYCSTLNRSRHSAEVILSELKCSFLPTVSDWRFNERHYGNLTGANKRDMANRYGEDQVQFWRRNYDGLPPPIETSNIYYYQICNNPAFQDVPLKEFPFTESMRMCVDRVSPVWAEIKTEIMQGIRVLIVVHGTVARALVKHIQGLSEEQIEKVNIPNSVPIVYEFNTKTGELIGDSKYLGDSKYIEKMTKKVAGIGD